MILCVGPNDKLQLSTDVATAIHVHISSMDVDASGNVSPIRRNIVNTSWNGLADLTVPVASGVTRNVKTLNIKNSSVSTTAVVTILHTDGTNTVELFKTALVAQQTLQYVEGQGWKILGGVALGTGLVPLAEIIPTDGQATVDFSSIPQSYRHLKIEYAARSATAGLASFDLVCQFNGDSGANYDWERHYATGTAVSAAESIAASWGHVGFTTGPTATTATRFARGTIDIPYYTDSQEKDAVGDWIAPRTTATGNTYRGTSGTHWRNASAITRVVLFPASGSAAVWGVGSKVTLYGVA